MENEMSDIKSRINKIKKSKINELKNVLLGLTVAASNVASARAETPTRDAESPKIEKTISNRLNNTKSPEQILREKLENEGAFFLDYEKYASTNDIAKSIVYMTNDEMAEKGINNLQTSPFDVSLARENHYVVTGDSVADAEKARAVYSNTKGTFNGGFQYMKSAMENMVLWGLVQTENPEVQNFCKKFASKGVDVDSNRAIQAYKNHWASTMAKVDAGKIKRNYALNILNAPQENQTRAPALRCLNVTKANFHRLSFENPKQSEELQKLYLTRVVMAQSSYSKKNESMSIISAPPAIAAIVHGMNISSTPTILNSDKSEYQKANDLITRHGDRRIGEKLMRQAQKQIENNGYMSISYCNDFAAYVKNDSAMLADIEKGINYACTSTLEKSGENGINYAQTSTVEESKGNGINYAYTSTSEKSGENIQYAFVTEENAGQGYVIDENTDRKFNTSKTNNPITKTAILRNRKSYTR